MKNLKIMICRYPGYSKRRLVEIPREAISLKDSYFFKFKLLHKFDFITCDTLTQNKYSEVMNMILGVLDKPVIKYKIIY